MLLPLFVPVILTGLALMALLMWPERKVLITLVLWALTVVLLGFCVLAALSFGILYLPAALALMAAAIVVSFRREGTACRRQPPEH